MKPGVMWWQGAPPIRQGNPDTCGFISVQAAGGGVRIKEGYGDVTRTTE